MKDEAFLYCRFHKHTPAEVTVENGPLPAHIFTVLRRLNVVVFCGVVVGARRSVRGFELVGRQVVEVAVDAVGVPASAPSRGWRARRRRRCARVLVGGLGSARSCRAR